jgi:hypothetical protein
MPFLLSIRTVFTRKGGRIWYDDQRHVHRQMFVGDKCTLPVRCASRATQPGAERFRPRDLARLAGCPTVAPAPFACLWKLVRTAGLEPTTSCSGGKRSIRLSYARTLKRW